MLVPIKLLGGNAESVVCHVKAATYVEAPVAVPEKEDHSGIVGSHCKVELEIAVEAGERAGGISHLGRPPQGLLRGFL